MPTHSRNHLQELDVIRFFAFFGVFFFHAIRTAPSGWMAGTAKGLIGPTLGAFAILTARDAGRFGVDLFFTLSAFLITTLLLKEWKTVGRIQLGKFYLRRILRIWPLYYSITFLVFGVAWLQHTEVMKPYFWPTMLMAPNWAWISLGTPPSPVRGFMAIVVFWSLGIEEQFYLAWGLILRFFRPGNLRLMAWGLILLSGLTRFALWCFAVPHPAIYANTIAHLDPIAVGILLAWEWMALPSRSGWKDRLLGSPAGLAAGILGFLAAGGISLIYAIDGTLFVFLGYPLVAWSGYLVLRYTLLNAGQEKARGHAFRALAYCGKISYGLYLFHLFVLGFFTPWLAGRLQPLGYGATLFIAVLSLAGTILIGHLSYRYFESPFLTLKEKFSPLGAAKSALAWQGVPAPRTGGDL